MKYLYKCPNCKREREHNAYYPVVICACGNFMVLKEFTIEDMIKKQIEEINIDNYFFDLGV